MIMRRWRALAADEAGYLVHFRHRVLPALRRIRGFRGAMVLRSVVNGGIEIEVLTLWRSMEAIYRFAGDNANHAVVEPEARAILRRFDPTVRHFEVILDAVSESAKSPQLRPRSARSRPTRGRAPSS